MSSTVCCNGTLRAQNLPVVRQYDPAEYITAKRNNNEDLTDATKGRQAPVCQLEIPSAKDEPDESRAISWRIVGNQRRLTHPDVRIMMGISQHGYKPTDEEEIYGGYCD